MANNHELHKKYVNVWFFVVWLIGGLLAFIIQMVVFMEKSIILRKDALYILYASIPFLALGVVIRFIFFRSDLSTKIFSTRLFGAICAFITLQSFYFAYTKYVIAKGHMFDVFTALYGFIPIIGLCILPIGYITGVAIFYAVHKIGAIGDVGGDRGRSSVSRLF